jgi:peptide-methionine (S)-S-oxide reductase
MDQTKLQERRSAGGKEIATLGGGCFWCLQPAFQDLRGVEKVEVGYSGGTVANPSYQQVCTGTTGHAEVVQVTFSPDLISYDEILEIFFAVHDPTTRDRQGADVGTQYRSVIFYHSQSQKEGAERVIRQAEAEKIWGAPVVTQVVPFEAFYRAEGYHQNYFENNPDQGYCRVTIAPKITKFRKKYASRLKSVVRR